ncbi:aspartate ammonia-lyase [Marinomonas piezotolerans]|uniref:Fumarate hydratase class II n=1 Tax=Marinomonas piezotolerans TaxID=2213058 RepID=A0A370U9V4_9GAMM|nr:class II fumarate hydratase [Marinomonas piezotolerans]RDL44566.1 aspartate ammonia-lyase [Marinomonas piezotolerans]
MKTRTEQDSMGALDVAEEALYGAQTQRAINNFPISGQRLPSAFIRALIQLKASAAKANLELDCLEPELAGAIERACETLLDDPNMMQHFPVDVFQTGSGTSTNMNANEVIATLASRHFSGVVGPNDHVNYGQSSNDIIPSAIHASAAIEVKKRLLPALEHLKTTITLKGNQLSHHTKTGRTHLMDAMPVRMDQTFHAWAAQLQDNLDNLNHALTKVTRLAQGGTAVGTGINAHPDFSALVTKELSRRTAVEFVPGENLFALIGSQDSIVALSGVLKATAVTYMKIANDLRWMNSGPLAGLGEITLEALQPGSSIMPGKVNPVIPEATVMVAAQVIGNDTAITVGGQSGNFELNVMLPMIAYNVLNSIELLTNSAHLLANKAIDTLIVNEAKLKEALDKNPILVTALNPIIGYAKAAEIAKKAYQEGRPIVDVAEEETELSREELLEHLNPAKLTHGGL